jgi:adenine phosphoribosyltransferase
VTASARAAVIDAFRWVDGHADIWRLFQTGEVFQPIVDELAASALTASATKVAGIEARGFILGGAVALRAGLGFAAVRKQAGLFPGTKRSVTAEPDYRGHRHVLRLREESIGLGDRVLLVDDWAEVGSQALAARRLIEDCGGTWAGVALIVDQLPDARRHQLAPVTSILTAAELGPSE